VPEPHIVKETAKILDLQDPTSKMSKSAESQSGVLDLLDEPATLTKKIKSAVTDTGREIKADPENKPGVTNLLTIFATVSGRTVAELEEAYAGKGYGDFKKDVAEAVVEFVTPIQERFHRYYDDAEALDAVLADGATRARTVAEQTMDTVRERVGFLAAKH
jgi:tryptophanyl-tRNA synthetase